MQLEKDIDSFKKKTKQEKEKAAKLVRKRFRYLNYCNYYINNEGRKSISCYGERNEIKNGTS